jgi:hypothetical protein
LAANYAFGFEGWDQTSGSLEHFALVGTFAQSGGNLSNLGYEANDGGAVSNIDLSPGNFGTIATIYADGQETVTLNLPGSRNGPVAGSIYVINSSEFFFVSITDGNQGAEYCGRAIAAPNTFSASSILPSYIFHLTGNSAGSATASLGVANFSGGLSGTVSGTFDQYSSGMASSQGLSGTYGMGTDTRGRLGIIGASAATSPTCYLTTPFDGVAAFCVGMDSSAAFGTFDVQPAASYSNSSLAGNYFLGTSEPGDNTVPDVSGVASIASGSVTGTEDASAPSGTTLGSAFTGTLSLNADGTGNMGANTVTVTNGTELYFINEANDGPAEVQVFEP